MVVFSSVSKYALLYANVDEDEVQYIVFCINSASAPISHRKYANKNTAVIDIFDGIGPFLVWSDYKSKILYVQEFFEKLKNA